MSFTELGLRAELLRAIETQGYTQPTPIQIKSIPVILTGVDVLAGAQTGTGKTAAFTLPMLQLLHERPRRNSGKAPRALVLTPTRELAAQIAESVEVYGEHLQQRSAVIFGGVNINPQKDILRRGIDVLVATPGRLLDHAGQKTIDLSAIEFLVLDEADRMLDMGFIHDIKRVLALLPKNRQNLLFSATFSDDIKRLADRLLNQPVLLEVARRNTAAETVVQHAYRIDQGMKRHLLAHLVLDGNWYQVLVFTRTKHGANRLAEQLVRAGIEASAIHGNKSQNARTRALAGFKKGEVRVLVATDIAARGLDIERLPHVVNYELPNVPEDYVHRIGRTGRAGEDGAAISLVSPDEARFLSDIERLLRSKIPVLPIPDFPTPPPQANSAANERGREPNAGRSTRSGNHARRGGGSSTTADSPSRPRRRRSRGGSRQGSGA